MYVPFKLVFPKQFTMMPERETFLMSLRVSIHSLEVKVIQKIIIKKNLLDLGYPKILLKTAKNSTINKLINKIKK